MKFDLMREKPAELDIPTLNWVWDELWRRNTAAPAKNINDRIRQDERAALMGRLLDMAEDEAGAAARGNSRSPKTKTTKIPPTNATLPTYLTPEPADEYDAFDDWFNAIVIMACLLLGILAGCGAGYAYAQRRRPAPIPSQAQLLRQNYAHGIYADELVDWHD